MKVLIFKARVPEHKIDRFEKAMQHLEIAYESTGEFRITNLDAWINGQQKSID